MERFHCEPGKSGRVVNVESQIPLTTPVDPLPTTPVLLHEEGMQEDKPLQPTNAMCTPMRGGGALPSGDVVILDTLMYNEFPESQIFDLYGIGNVRASSIPFVYGVELDGPNGEIVRMRSVFDDGAMVNAINADVFAQVKSRLSPLYPSTRLLRMADGRIIGSKGVWSGTISVGGARGYGDFEVFKSGNAWALLFGKPLLERFWAVHDYDPDEIVFPTKDGPIRIQNQFSNAGGLCGDSLVGLTIDIKQREKLKGDSSASPSRQVSTPTPLQNEITIDVPQPTECDWWECPDFEGDNAQHSVWIVDEAAGTSSDHPGVAQPELPKERDPSTYTRLSDPFQQKRVVAILEDVTIGPDLSTEQHAKVQALLAEFADCFALSLREVLPVKGAEHHLNIPEGSKFRTRVHQ